MASCSRGLLGVFVVLLVVGCAGQRRSRPPCSLRQGDSVSERTGEHTLVLTVIGCAVRTTPHVELFAADGRRIPFAYVPIGGSVGARRVTLDKYRCDVRTTTVARRVQLTLATGSRLTLRLGPEPVMDWCPAEAPSFVVRIYLGGVHRAGTYRDVFHDVYDGRLDTSWSCAALRTAIAHLPVDGPVYSRLPGVLARAAAPACDNALTGLPAGAPKAAVVAALGRPDVAGARCPVWRWRPESGTVDGARICFAHGRATAVETAVHG